MPRIYGEQVATNLRSGQTLLFAHGLAIHYRTIVPRRDVDVIMVAPKGLGPMVRGEFLRGRGAPGLIAIHQNPSKQAKQTALAWAKGIGCTRAGVIETTFRQETETDLFGEQAVLCGGTSALIRAGFDTLVAAGYPPELAYFECLYELKFIVDLIHEAGISGMRKLISDTAKWGELTVGPKVIDPTVQKRMRSVLQKIRSGQLAREFIREMKPPRTRYEHLLLEAEKAANRKSGRATT
jgi:ketol-acid reductoisomerase